MLRMWKAVWLTGGLAPFYDAPDAPGAGGADPRASGDGSQPSGEAGDLETDDATGAADGDDADRDESLEDLLVDGDDEPETDSHGRTRTADERIKALAKKNRKVKRQLAKLLPLANRFKDVDVDDLMQRVRAADRLEQQLQRNPKLRALLYGDAEDEPARSTRSQPEKEPAFDEKSLPWDPNENDANKYLSGMARKTIELEQTVKQLLTRLDSFEGRDTARSEHAVRSSWKSAIDAAAEHIKDEGVRDVFKDALAGAYQTARQKGIPVQRIISHYLQKLGVDPKQATRANSAAAAAGAKPAANGGLATRQRIAEQNRNLPRTVAPAGSPAPARSTRETLADVRRRITGAAR